MAKSGLFASLSLSGLAQILGGALGGLGSGIGISGSTGSSANVSPSWSQPPWSQPRAIPHFQSPHVMSIFDYIKNHVPYDRRFFGVYWELERNIEGRPRYAFLTVPDEGGEYELYCLEPDGTVRRLNKVKQNEVDHDSAGHEITVSVQFLESLSPFEAMAFAKAVKEFACAAMPDHLTNGYRIKFKDGPSFMKFCAVYPSVLA